MTLDHRRANIFALFCCALFFITGTLWISRPGVQTDEALFSAGIYAPFGFPESRVRVFNHDYTIMVMTYVGALKARIWSPIFRFLGVSGGTLRVPAVLIATLSIWWFYRLMRRTLGIRSAVIACGLLATDSLYLLTARWDWGPVVLQHTLLIGGLLGVVCWWQDGRKRWLALGFFAFGLAMWDKALFAWSMVGLGVAVLVIFPRELRRSIQLKPLAIATAAFLIGAWPLIIYNVRTDWSTFRSNAQRSNEDMLYKASLLKDTINGSAMFGSITRSDWDGPVKEPTRWFQRVVVSLSQGTGGLQHHLQLWALVIALLCLPLVWHTTARRAALFALVFALVTWAQMLPVQNGGTGVHHTILLWPMPALIIGAVFGALAERSRNGNRMIALITGLCMILGLLVTSTYYRDLLRNGGVPTWTDAFYPAMASVREQKPESLCIVEWGLFDNSRAFVKGRINIEIASDPSAGEIDKRAALAQMANPKNLFITHVKGVETEPGRADRIVSFAASQGYTKANSRVFADSNGRPIIELFSFITSP